MEIKIRVPHWVNTDDEGICMLFAFLRKIGIEYNIRNKALDVYGYDIRRILDREENNIHDYIADYVDHKHCKIAKLNREHFVFTMKNDMAKKTRIVLLKKHSSHVRWAYLMGCSNYNLLEEDNDELILGRPQYTGMYRLERDVFEFSNRNSNDT